MIEEKLIDMKLLNVEHKLSLTDKEREGIYQAWNNYKDAIKAVFAKRVAEIEQHLIYQAHPVEVMPLRQALSEIMLLLEDFENTAANVEKEREDEKMREVEDKEETEEE